MGAAARCASRCHGRDGGALVGGDGRGDDGVGGADDISPLMRLRTHRCNLLAAEASELIAPDRRPHLPLCGSKSVYLAPFEGARPAGRPPWPAPRTARRRRARGVWDASSRGLAARACR